MKKEYLIISLLLLFLSCKKEEGLTKETGNLEVTKSMSLVGYPMCYKLFTEDQYYLYLSNKFSVPLKEGSTTGLKLNLTSLAKGNYGICLSYNGDYWQKWIYIVPDKINKISMP